MDEDSRQLKDDCFLRPISDPKTTNTPFEPSRTKVPVKAELQVLRLSDESQKLTMETLCAVHGPDFRLDDPSKYKDRGGAMKKSYWQDRGTLIVHSVTNFQTRTANDGNADDTPENRMRRYALTKLENYGFPLGHCIEAYDSCEGDTDAALHLLFRKYMRIPDSGEGMVSSLYDPSISDEELQAMRDDEKSALESIYEKSFEEKERNTVWNLKFKIDHLLPPPPSSAIKSSHDQEAKNRAKKSKDQICRNFQRDGTCRWGPKCRFVHVKPEENKAEDDKKTKKKALDENENEMWFYLEIRFPSGTKYPYEAPYTFLKTTCHDIKYETLLRVSRHLYRAARESCHDGMPCVYTISEILQNDKTISDVINRSKFNFPDPDKSLFDVNGPANGQALNGLDDEELPTHYERGETARGNALSRDPQLLEREDRNLVKRFTELQNKPSYRDMMKARQKLPAADKMQEILQLLGKSQVLVISGETGCGKSTQVPQFILDDWLFSGSKLKGGDKLPHVEIVCTQPRRLSAIGVAERVANERTEGIGKTIGYQIRLENKISQSTRLTFCTTGILLRRLASDPELSSVTHVIVDEVHERSEESDFLLMILKEILPKRRDLKVILMSATLNAKLFSDYFGGVPVLDIPGRTFPVEQVFLEEILEACDFVMECDSQFSRKVKRKEEEELLNELEYADMKSENVAPPVKMKDENLNLAALYARYKDYSRKTCKSIFLMEPMKVNPELIESVLDYIVQKPPPNWPRDGSILVFLPGLQDIQSVHNQLNDSSLFSPRAGKFILVPLHSTLSSEEQSAVFRPAPKGKRKIVLSTNIAETSITIDDCTYVIDCGLMKEKGFDSNRNMESLDLVWASRANALQRKGRAGRVMPGVCIHLFTSHRFYHGMLSQPVPEIHRVPLEKLLLHIKTLPNFENSNVIEVLGRTIEPPIQENITSAVERLQNVGAFDDEHNLTPLGHHLAALPVDVRIGKLMLFGAIFQCLDSVLTIAACLSYKSPFVCPFNKRSEAEKAKRQFAICNSDHLACLLAYKKWLEVSRRSYFASRNYADEHYLSLTTLETIAEMKHQLLELLVSIGFVPVNVPRRRKTDLDNILTLTGHDLNANGENNRLLIALMCAALYPNIVKILTPERSYVQTAAGAMPKADAARDLRFKTRDDGYVAIHPSSVNANISSFASPFLVFQEKVKTSRIFIRECSMLSITSLVLFASSNLRVELHGGDFIFLIEDGWILLKAQNHGTAEMLQCLRTELVKLLEEKIRDPCLNLLNHENGRKIIKNIVYLVTQNN